MNQKKSKRLRRERAARGEKHEPNYVQIRNVRRTIKQKDGTEKIETSTEPVNAGLIDSRTHGREFVNQAVKSQNGNMSKFIPAKFGYGPMGEKKY